MTTPTNSNLITLPVGTSSNVDQSVTPYMRAREIEFTASNLRPNRQAQFFFNDINVTRFVQRCSTLVTDTANTIFGYDKGERLYCNTTHAFASIVGAAANNNLYINQNYLAVNVAAVGANTVASGDFTAGDIVYQAFPNNPSPTVATFEGQVVYWNYADRVLVLQPLNGTLNSNTTANMQAVLYKSGINYIIQASTIVNGNMFPVNAVVSSLDNVANRFLVNTWRHHSGSITQAAAVPNANCIIISGTAPSDIVGNVIFMSAQHGAGQGGTVLSVSGNVVYTNTAFNPLAGGNTYYSIGQPQTDNLGIFAGIFNLPESPTVSFLTGSATFTISDSTIVDDPDATMLATGTYVAQGFLGQGTTPVVQPTTTPAPAAPPIAPQSASASSSVPVPMVVMASPGPNTTYAGVISQVQANTLANGLYNGVDVLSSGWGTFTADPLAQSFFTPSANSYGIFVSSIDLWFSEVPEGSSPQFPVQVKIVTTENGFPTSNVLASSEAIYNDIVTSSVPDSANVGSLISQNQTVTTFTFDDPVFLAPATQYAIVVYTESPDYELFVSEVGQVDITSGANQSRVSSAPYAGAFFRAQNASTWSQIQNQNLMFVINQAVFSTQPVSFTYNLDPVTNFVPFDSLMLHSIDASFAPTTITYKALTTLANTFGPEAAYRQYTIDQPFSFGQDLSISSLYSNRRRVVLPGNNQSILLQVSLASTNPDVSPIFNEEVLSAVATTNIINPGGINQENISITYPGFHNNANNIVVTISAPDLVDGTQATANVPFLNSNAVTFIYVQNPGSGYSKSPTITISELGISNVATAVASCEDGKLGGNGIARYVTRQITLANGFASGDLRVFLNAIRPSGTDVLVYYKVLSATDTQTFDNLPWVEMVMIQDINSPDQLTTVQLSYCPALGPNGLPSGTLSYHYNGTQYPLGGTFQYFAIKIVMFADDTTVCPSVSSMSAICYPAG